MSSLKPSSTYANPEALVGTEWLAANMAARGVRVVDGTMHLPNVDRDARAEFLERHLPGAGYFDIDVIADRSSDLPHMLPDAGTFGRETGALGISNDDLVIVYDAYGLFSAGRVWWMFRAMGHDKVAVLDGGLPKWLAEERPVESGAASPAPAVFEGKARPELVRAWGDMLANIDSGAAQVLDARAPGRFSGSEPEFRAGLRSGHIPGSLNLPYPGLVDPADGTMLPAATLESVYAQAGVDLAEPIVTTCGSGVTAGALALGLFLLGRGDVAVYDGSWTEWGGRDDTPIET